jgi:hypothetical protein
MSFVTIAEKKMMYRYVLHARHGSYEEPYVSLKMLMGRNFDKFLKDATEAF